MNIFSLAQLLFKEFTCRGQSARLPEPTQMMNEQESVMAFDNSGAKGGVLEPLYYVNAKAISARLSQGATVLDLGCGSAQFLVFLAKFRPDIKIIGIDLSPMMIELGRKRISDEGLQDRVEIHMGDMTKLQKFENVQVHFITSIFSLHHLPSVELAQACIGQITNLIIKKRCGFWCFDHVRPRSIETAKKFPKVFSADSPEAFQLDSENSLIAAFTFEELQQMCKGLVPEGLQSQKARVLPFYQVHRVGEQHNDTSIIENISVFSENAISKGRQFRALTCLG